MMPGIDGFETCRRLKSAAKTRDIPVIFMTALSDTASKVEGFEAGGVDYITKPFQHKEVLARVTTHLTLRNLQKSMQQEIVRRKQLEAQLRHAAMHDFLTGLPNRAMFIEQLNQAIQRIRHDPTCLFTILLLDLDQFKSINDTPGHLIGDQLLTAVGHRLQQCVRPNDIVARLGGDEFTILLNDIRDSGDAIKIVDRIQTELALPLELDGLQVSVTTSIGIASTTTRYNRVEDLMHDADTAMYQAKAAGPGQYRLFDAIQEVPKF